MSARQDRLFVGSMLTVILAGVALAACGKKEGYEHAPAPQVQTFDNWRTACVVGYLFVKPAGEVPMTQVFGDDGKPVRCQ